MVCRILALIIFFGVIGESNAATLGFPGIDIQFGGEREQLETGLKILLALTVLSLVPAILVVMTSFTRIIVVLSILRQAFGMQQTPPNTVLISLALFLTIFTMMPNLQEIQSQALNPYLSGEIEIGEATEIGLAEMRDFMIKQTNEQDMALIVSMANSPRPNKVEDINILILVPAFMLSELKTAFQIGFIIFLPFLLIDLVVASSLMSMGMLMVPPMMISLPIKILMFVLIDGWNLVVESLVGSFQ